MCKKNRTLYQLGTEKIAFPPKPDGQTDGHKWLYSGFATKNSTITRHLLYREASDTENSDDLKSLKPHVSTK